MKTTIAIKQGEVIKKTAYQKPGAGAIEFARRYISAEMDYEEMLEVMTAVVDGNFEEYGDKKVKHCQCCAFFFRDKTKNNSSVVCSPECKAVKDAVIKTYTRRVRTEQAGTARKSYKHGRYYGGEYSFWCNDEAMFEYDRKRGIYAHGDDLEEVIAAAQKRALMGGKKKVTTDVDFYEADWSNKPTQRTHDFYGTTNTTGGKVKVIKRSREEIEVDLLARYGEKKLALARKRALDQAKGRH